MANNEMKVIIGADDRPLLSALSRAGSALKSFGGTLGNVLGVGAGIGIFTVAAAGLSTFVGGAIDEFKEAERSVKSLQQSLESIGREDVFAGIVKQASELQRQFKFLDNDDITNAFQKLIQFGGLTQDSINRLIPVIIDLNAKQRLAGDVNKTVASSAEDIVRGLSGQGRELKKYGLELKASNTEAENLSQILDTLGTKVKGAADAFGNSLEGKIAATTQRAADLSEELGSKLLPIKAGVLQFAVDLSTGFEKLSERIAASGETIKQIAQGLGIAFINPIAGITKLLNIQDTYNDVLDKQARSQFATNNANSLFDQIKDLPVDELTTQLIQYTNRLDELRASVNKGFDFKNPLAGAAGVGSELEIEALDKLIPKIKELVKVRGDNRVLGQRDTSDKEAKTHKTVADALKVRIAALHELIKAEVDVSKNQLELKNLDIQLTLRDAKTKGFSQDEVEKLIFAKYPDFKGGLTLSQPLNITAPVSFDIDIQKNISELDAVGDDLSNAITRTYDRISAAGEAAGKAAREKIAAPLVALNDSIQSTLSNTFANLGDAIGEAFSGGNIIGPFLSVIADALIQLGKALIVFGIAKKLAIDAFKTLNPFVAIGAGIAAVAAGKILQGQLKKVHAFAEGGLVTGPTLGLVGEAGPELIIPLSKADKFLGSNDVRVYGEFKLSGNDLVASVQRAMGSQSRRS